MTSEGNLFPRVLFYLAPGAREWTGVGEDPGSEVEPKGHEHEVKNLLYHEVIFRGRIVLEFFHFSFAVYTTNIFEGLSSYCIYKSLLLKMTMTISNISDNNRHSIISIIVTFST